MNINDSTMNRKKTEGLNIVYTGIINRTRNRCVIQSETMETN